MGYLDTDELYEALKKGTVSMEDFMDTIVELNEVGGDGITSFEEQAKNSTNSIGTALTNVGNRFKKGFATILESLDEMAMKTKFGSIAGMINEFSNSMKNFLDKIGNAIKDSQSVKDFMAQLEKALTKLKDTIDNLSAEQIEKLIDGFITLAKIGPALLLIGKAFSGIGKIISVAGNVASSVGTISEAVQIFSGATATGSAGATALAGAMSFLTGPVGIALAVITALTIALVTLYKKSEKFRDAVNTAFESVKESLLNAWETLKPSLEELWSSLQELFEALKPIGNFLIDVLVVAVQLLAEALKIIIPILTETIKLTVDFFTNIIKNAENFINTVMWLFSDLPKNLGILLGYLMGKLYTFGIDAYNWVTTEIPKVVNGIIDWFKKLPSEIWNWLVQTTLKLAQWILQMGDKGREGGENFSNNILDILANLPRRMGQVGLSIVQGLWNGIQSAYGWIVSKVQSFANGILEGMKSALQIHSPSKKFEKLGFFSAEGYGIGFINEAEKMFKKMKATVDFQTQKLSANLSTSAVYNKDITVNSNIVGNVELDGNRVGRLIAPSVSKTLRTAGA